jgi:hypothetical protein
MARDSGRAKAAAHQSGRIPAWLPPVQVEDEESDEDLFEEDGLGPLQLRTTPERPVFTPTPPGQSYAAPNTYSFDSPMRECKLSW